MNTDKLTIEEQRKVESEIMADIEEITRRLEFVRDNINVDKLSKLEAQDLLACMGKVGIYTTVCCSACDNAHTIINKEDAQKILEFLNKSK